MRKKLLVRLLALFMCLSMLPATALATDTKPLDISQVTVKDNLSYDSASVHNSYIRVTSGQKYGLLDCNGNEVIPVIYDSLTFVADDLVAVGQNLDNNGKTGAKNTKCGLMDMNGNWVVPLKYDRIDPYYEDMAAVYVDNTMGFIDKTGKEVIPLRYNAAVSNNVEVWPDDVSGSIGIFCALRSGFSDGVACVRKGGVTSVIDKQGKVLFETDLLIHGFSDGRAKAVQIPPDDGPQDNMIISDVSLKYGYMDKTGKMVIPAIYDDAYDFSEGYAVVGKQNSSGETLYGAIDRAGNIVVPLIYHGMTPFHEGMARVYEQDKAEPGHWYKYGFVNTKGELVVPMIYQEASNYSNGMAVVAVKDKRFKEEEEDHHQCLFGCIDKQGNVVIPLEYCASFTFHDGVAYVCKGYPYSLYNPRRHPREKFDEFCERFRELGMPQECSLIDTEGKTLISFGDRGRVNYTDRVDFSGNIAVYRKSDGKYAIIKNPLNERQPKPTFTDVPAGNWAFEPVAWTVENGITNGYGTKDKFAPTIECTEAQILTFLYRANRGGGTPVAEDMNKAISWAREKGMIDENFKQNAPCTRAQAVKFIWEAFGKQTATKPASFTDVDMGADYAEAVSWAVEKKVTKGYGGNDTFAPDRVCNRGEIVTFLYRAYNN